MNMKFLEITMKYMPEAKQFFDSKGIELSMEDLQPMLELLMKVMNEAYELGKQESGS